MTLTLLDGLISVDQTQLIARGITDAFLEGMRRMDLSNNSKAVAINSSTKGLLESAIAMQQQSAAIESSASTGVSSTSSNEVTTDAITNQQEVFNQAAEFRISFKDSLNKEQVFKFSLLPATEVRGGGSSIQVPDIKPGILLRTSMNIKRFAIPGAAPAFQVLGIEQTILQLVGLFIGNEGPTANAGTSNATSLYVNNRSLDAPSTASYFDREVVQIGRPVTLYVYALSNGVDAPLTMEYRCLIQAMRYFVAKSDRVYYAMEALVLDYKQVAAPLISRELASAAVDVVSSAIGGVNLLGVSTNGTSN